MTRWMLCAATLLLSTLFLPVQALAQPTSPGTAVKSAHIGTVNNVVIDDTDAQKWFQYHGRMSGRSYCAEVTAGADESSATSASSGDPSVAIFDADGTTLIKSNQNTNEEPDALWGARACFQTVASGSFYVRVSDAVSGTHAYRMRVVETTLWASWFFIGGDYNSFVLLRNTTNTSVNYTVTWRSPTGAVTGTTSGTVAGNAALGINARNFIGNPAVNFNGTVEIAHTGSPQALVGQVTSLSATTGLGYDATLFQRQPW